MAFQYKLRSVVVLGAMYALLFAILYVVNLLYWQFSELIVVGIALGFLLLQYLISPFILKWIYRIHWLSPEDVKHYHPNLANIIDQVVRKYDIKPPTFGIIHDLSPNAFTFGWTKNSANIVITDGILDLLDEDEQTSVVAHELGHIVHNDFIVMTVASAIPILFYTIFRMLLYSRGGRRSGRGDSNTASLEALRYAIAIASWIMYFLGTFIMLFLSRVREFWADEFSARETKRPNALSTSLVKISYGLLQKPESTRKSRETDDYTYRRRGTQSKQRVQYLKGLGIYDKNSAKNLIYSGAATTNTQNAVNENIIAKSAAWDLYTPWAKYFNLMSTHPLPAKRIKKLNDLSVKDFNQVPEIDLSPAKKEFEREMGKSGWDEFFYEIFIQWMPKLIFLAWIIAGISLFATGFDFTSIPVIRFNNLLSFLTFSLVVAGALQVLQTFVKYDSNFEPSNIKKLVTTIRVSPVRPVPAIVRGRVLGRGSPGLFYSEDVFIRDNEGLLYIDYDYGVGFINTLFGIFRTRKLVGRNVEVTGWYRRGPRPYLQVHQIQLLDTGDVIHCRKKLIWQILGGVLIVLGLALWFYLNSF